ncbi:MAG: RNA polymerase sigma factor, partial [Gammaproteobacteria bacterium]
MDSALTEVATRCETIGEGIAPEAFEQIVSSYQRRIYRLLLVLVGERDAADTLTQECFLRAYRKRASFRGESSIETWLVRIAVNLARDCRKNRRLAFWRRVVGQGDAGEVAAATDGLNEAHPSPERIVAAREGVAAVWCAADSLPPRQRTIFLLRFAEEMDLREIARVMELEVGTVKTHLFRA